MDRKSRLPVRSNSSDRFSRGRSLTTSSTDKKRSSSADKYATPRTLNLKPRTGSSSINRRKSPLANKDKRPINDPQWQKEQLSKITTFINSIEPSITNFKKPSVNDFVVITTILLTELSEDFEINKENYKVELPNLLKLLSFPGTVSKSVLQCPYASNAFPTIISLWSYLLDLIIDKNSYDQETSEILTLADVRSKYQLMHLHVITNGGDLEKHFSDFEKELVTLFGSNETEINNLRKELEAEINLRDEELKTLESATVNLKILKNKVQERQNEVDTHHFNFMEEQKRINAEIDNYIENIPLLDEKIKIRKEIIENISTSDKSYTEEDIKSSENEVERQKVTLGLLEKRRNEYLSQIDELDKEYTKKIEEIERKVHENNNNLQKIALYFPEADLARLPEQGFLKPSFMQEMLDKTTFLQNLKDKMASEINTINLAYSENMNMEKELKNRITELEEYKETLTESLKDLEKENEKLKCDLELEDLKREVKELQSKLKQLEMEQIDITPIQTTKEEAETRLAELEKEKQEVYDKCYKEVHHFYDVIIPEQVKILVAITQSNKQREENLKKIRGILKEIKDMYL